MGFAPLHAVMKSHNIENNEITNFDKISLNRKVDDFINECLNAGGSDDLDCYKDYFSLSTRKGNIDVLNVNDILVKEKVKQLTKN